MEGTRRFFRPDEIGNLTQHLGDPTGVAGHVRDTLAPDGTEMIVEPFAEVRLEDNLNPVGRVFSSGSTTIWFPRAAATPFNLVFEARP